MDRDDTPCALHAELLEESCSHDFVAARERIGVEQSAANNGDEDNAEAAAKDLGGVADESAACHGA